MSGSDPVNRDVVQGHVSRRPRARLAVAVLALAGASISTYLTLYQWHVTQSVWDPFFGAESAERVLTSALSRSSPVPDATLGAFAYLVEAALALSGASGRWRDSPGLSVLYAVVLLGLAATSTFLVVAQIALVRSLCALCVGSAAVSWANAAIGWPEARATLSNAFAQVKERDHGGIAHS